MPNSEHDSTSSGGRPTTSDSASMSSLVSALPRQSTPARNRTSSGTMPSGRLTLAMRKLACRESSAAAGESRARSASASPDSTSFSARSPSNENIRVATSVSPSVRSMPIALRACTISRARSSTVFSPVTRWSTPPVNGFTKASVGRSFVPSCSSIAASFSARTQTMSASPSRIKGAVRASVSSLRQGSESGAASSTTMCWCCACALATAAA